MPRNSNGTFTLVAGNPVITGTIIESDWANTTMPDMGVELSDSLSRSGKGGMLAALKAIDGTETSPAYTFTNFLSQGLYSEDLGDVRMTSGQTDRMRWTPDAVQVWGIPEQMWFDVLTNANFVNSEIETQTLTNGQTVVVFTEDINGAGFTINGEDADNGRLLVGVDYTLVVATNTVTLTNSYPEGTLLTAMTAGVADFDPITTTFVESQPLTDGQLVVVFSNSIDGASMVINGVNADSGRLLGGIDFIKADSLKTVTLTNSYPAGTTLSAIRPDVADSDSITMVASPFVAFPDLAATPSVLGSNNFITANTAPTSITLLTSQVDGQMIRILFNDDDTTIVASTDIRLAGAADFVGSAQDTLTLIYSSTTGEFHEVSRSVN